MKIAIATFQSDNYGTKLQNYALRKALSSMGVGAESIYIKYKLATLSPIVRGILKNPIHTAKRKKNFIAFTRKHLNRNCVTRTQARHLSDQYDLFIVGSDQVWNPNHLRRHPKDRELFFLNITEREKRVAYAPSFGVEIIEDKDAEFYKNALVGFKHLSAREASGVKIMKQLTGKDVDAVPDPTFLLNKEDWSDITRDFDDRYMARKYAVVYYLSGQSAESYLRIERYAQENELELVFISGDLYTKGSVAPGPAEFVSLIKHAQVVFTDSFHACIFSIINESPFVVRRRTDVSQFTRIENLLGGYNLKDAIDNDGDIVDIVARLDFTTSAKEINIQKNKGRAYLKESLGL